MNKCVERLYNGIVKENPTFVLMLGMCPTLAVTTAAINGVGMGLASTAVLTLSNIMISMLRKVIPGRVRRQRPMQEPERDRSVRLLTRRSNYFCDFVRRIATDEVWRSVAYNH